jgi:pyridinium-3,5-biscarboxylic acid mononucleotide synthase
LKYIPPLKIPDKELKDGITVICAGTSDINIAEEAAITANLIGNRIVRIYDIGVAGIHRLLSQKDKLKNSNVIVAVEGMEDLLPVAVSKKNYLSNYRSL